jgi:hypothetical protein
MTVAETVIVTLRRDDTKRAEVGGTRILGTGIRRPSVEICIENG